MFQLLVVSDIHGSLENLEKLAELIVRNSRNQEYFIDGLICIGDIMSKKDELSTSKTSSTEDMLPPNTQQIVTILQKLASVFMTIGNHDHDLLLSFNTPDHFNVIKDGFLPFHNVFDFFMLHGSTPAYTSNNEFYWYGSRTESEIIDSFLQFDIATRQKPVVFVTHNGPIGINTTRDYSGKSEPSETINVSPPKCPDYIEAGSTSLLSILEDYHEHIPLWLHGHVHEGWGLTHFGSTTIVNPGALKDGRFAIIQLLEVENRIIVKDVKFLSV
eukprot:TRINITY_DN2682_c0_g1_i1.p1 TRINITY_DN2682_c0_g1~~TRINITY_DN2682_c0_g1_i1.p1  ORF type:complete len:272 (-),score=65.07 TRINITY_DN2682_c0_g1_i1:345-1160(-)